MPTVPEFPDVAVVGMHFREREGVPAKAIVGNFFPPVALAYEREPTNAYDSFAIKILYDGLHIGYVEANQACWIAPWMDQGHFFTCTCTHKETRGQQLHPIVTFTPLQSEEQEAETVTEQSELT